MTSWTTGPWTTYDSETSGVSVESDRIVSAYIGRVGGGEPTQGESFLINPGIEVPQAAIDVHGLTNEYLQENGKPPAEVLDLIAADLALSMNREIPVVGMNIRFDLDMLQYELRRNELPTLDERLGREVGPCIDVLVIDKGCHKFRAGSRKLLALASHYSIDLPEESAHGAEADAMAAARITWRLSQLASNEKVRKVFCAKDDVAAAYASLGEMDVWELHRWQVAQYRKQSESYATYLKKNKKPVDGVTYDWPVCSLAPVKP